MVPKLKEPEPNPGVVLSVLSTIGDLAEVSGGDSELQQWMHELMQILLEILGDASAPDKREAALCTLGQLVGATGHVVSPYNHYPVLLDVLMNFLKTEQQPCIRRETIRVLGLLGNTGLLHMCLEVTFCYGMLNLIQGLSQINS